MKYTLTTPPGLRERQDKPIRMAAIRMQAYKSKGHAFSGVLRAPWGVPTTKRCVLCLFEQYTFCKFTRQTDQVSQAIHVCQTPALASDGTQDAAQYKNKQGSPQCRLTAGTRRYILLWWVRRGPKGLTPVRVANYLLRGAGNPVSKPHDRLSPWKQNQRRAPNTHKKKKSSSICHGIRTTHTKCAAS